MRYHMRYILFYSIRLPRYMYVEIQKKKIFFGDPSESGLPLQCETSLVLPTPSIAAARSNAIQLRDTRRNTMVTTKTVSIAQRERNIFLLTKNNPKRPRQSACVCCGFPPSCCHRTPARRKTGPIPIQHTSVKTF